MIEHPRVGKHGASERRRSQAVPVDRVRPRLRTLKAQDITKLPEVSQKTLMQSVEAFDLERIKGQAPGGTRDTKLHVVQYLLGSHYRKTQS